jgi:hypothetical protein
MAYNNEVSGFHLVAMYENDMKTNSVRNTITDEKLGLLK